MRRGCRVQVVVLLSIQAVAAQLVPRGHGPHGGIHAPVAGQQLAGLARPRHANAGGEQLSLGAAEVLVLIDVVDALDDALDIHVLRLGRLVDRLVVHGDVVHDVRIAVASVAVHALQAIRHDVADFVGVGRIIGDERVVGGSEDLRVAVHVLQALARERRATGGRADDEALGELVARGPELVARALEAEH